MCGCVSGWVRERVCVWGGWEGVWVGVGVCRMGGGGAWCWSLSVSVYVSLYMRVCARALEARSALDSTVIAGT